MSLDTSCDGFIISLLFRFSCDIVCFFSECERFLYVYVIVSLTTGEVEGMMLHMELEEENSSQSLLLSP